MKTNSIAFLLVCIFYAPISSYAQHNLDAHTHGEGRMTLVYDSGQMLIEIKTPAANMLGFEHKPNSYEQWQTLKTLTQTLHDPKNMIVLEPDCKLYKSNIELPFEWAAHKESKGSNNKHGKGHEHEHEEEHEHGKEHEHPKEADSANHSVNHTDILVQYEWLCEKTYLPKLTFQYFDKYPNFKHLEVEWIINGSQGSTHLHKNKNTLSLAQ